MRVGRIQAGPGSAIERLRAQRGGKSYKTRNPECPGAKCARSALAGFLALKHDASTGMTPQSQFCARFIVALMLSKTRANSMAPGFFSLTSMRSSSAFSSSEAVRWRTIELRS